MSFEKACYHHFPFAALDGRDSLKGPSLSYGIIVLNYSYDSLARLLTRSLWDNAQIRACADGGTNVLWQFSMKENAPYIPDFISGDMDSITDESRTYFEKHNVPFVLTPDQCATDFTKCVAVMLERAAEHKLDFIYVFSSPGGRFDQIMANIHTLCLYRETIVLYMITENDLTFLLRPGSNYLHVKSNMLGEYCGLIPVNGPVQAVTRGLKWNITTDTQLDFHSLVSSSNTYDEQWLENENIDYVDILARNYLIWSMTYTVQNAKANGVVHDV